MTTATATSTDRIERNIHIQAPRARVWRALSEAESFGQWFGVDLRGKRFAPGERIQGAFTIPGHEHMTFDIIIESVEPERAMAWRWHPGIPEAGKDFSKEERTKVAFTLEDSAGGTLLTVVESGFDKVPPERRMEAFRGNTAGWEWQLKRIEAYATAQ